MVPIPIGDFSVQELENPVYLGTIRDTKCWVVENVRTMRRFISSLRLGISIDEIRFFEINKDYHPGELDIFLTQNITQGDIGVASEAGLPGMADPGAAVALWAHEHDIAVVPLVGPGSLVLALMASGLNGQQFTFHGYAPIKENELRSFLANVAKQVATGYTQIFIETPYRSDRFLQHLLQGLPPHLHLCIAFSIHNPGSFIRTRKVQEWKNDLPALGKEPCVFLVGL